MKLLLKAFNPHWYPDKTPVYPLWREDPIKTHRLTKEIDDKFYISDDVLCVLLNVLYLHILCMIASFVSDFHVLLLITCYMYDYMFCVSLHIIHKSHLFQNNRTIKEIFQTKENDIN